MNDESHTLWVWEKQAIKNNNDTCWFPMCTCFEDEQIKNSPNEYNIPFPLILGNMFHNPQVEAWEHWQYKAL
jgi:hypothetical protein